MADYRSLFIGLDAEIPLFDGSCRCYINLDNAASTPPLKAVQQVVDGFLTYYSSVHRGTGFKSQISTHAYEQARQIVMHFLGADPATHTCIFGKNTTEAINKLARRFPYTSERNIVITTAMEHHSNDLPWRAVTDILHVGLTPDGRLDEADFDTKLAQYGSRVALVAITGASNVTGYLNPIHRLAEKTHQAGALFLADCAQLAPHRPGKHAASGRSRPPGFCGDLGSQDVRPLWHRRTRRPAGYLRDGRSGYARRRNGRNRHD